MQKSLRSRDYQLFLRLLKTARREAGLTQADLAERMAVTQSFVSKCERGERRLDVVELRAWCRALETPFPAFVAHLDRAAKRGN